MNSTVLTLYIDPGTGSMLFSILIGAAATLFFLAKALFLKLKLFFSGKKGGVAVDSSYKKYVIYCEGKQYWNVFKPVADEFEKRGIELTYYTSAKDDPVFNETYKYVKPEFIGEGNVAFAKLNMLSAGFVLMTTPGLQVYQLKRSKRVAHYSHVLHMPNDATTYRLFGLDYFDSVLLTGDYQKDDIRALENQRGIPQKELVTVGCTYLDVLSQKIKSVPQEENHPFTVLVSPSWGKVGVLARYGEKLLDPLVKTGWRIIVRPHPQSKKSEPEMLERLEARYKDNKNLEWDYERDNIYSMKKADMMISDFSGIIFDYTFLCDKPVMYVSADMDLMPYDAYDLDKQLWQFAVLEKMGIKLDEKDFDNIKEVIQNASDSPELAAQRKIAKETAWMHIGEAGKRIADYMIQKTGD
ncbi:MAG: CDP-glycerol glycerophosphotransferase family protein [Treponema porcinum]|uniref:CDP-glycerol glycerophosphotransferase family protein n=1 Tax=Treponema porcinum TaxID=261392 RepID=UPI002357141E|nr:CDP-glycerol glycerophosphotransferase family protein [Treponema porcinum]MCI7080993.1 CDP-glycerol glycerophosphotransferase family protein [Treponema porcinum]MDY4189883.1 CDP-glycerol glycerophosphotransferase family protein [Treponema porcinum]MDY5120307.1 CDP-glycerol glycerophosphotransferase family protein [Treponema porcinum]